MTSGNTSFVAGFRSGPVACGPGTVSRVLARRIGPTGRVLGEAAAREAAPMLEPSGEVRGEMVSLIAVARA